MIEVIEQAIAAGKFRDTQRAKYERMYASDPQGTTALIAKLEPVPLLAAFPEGVSPLFGGRALSLEFEDSMVTPQGERPALSTYPTTADPEKVETLFPARPPKRTPNRVAFGE